MTTASHLHLHEPCRAEGRWPERIGILNDYVRIPYANGSSFASQFLYREFRARGHRVTVVGPEDPETRASDLPDRSIFFPSLPFRFHPGLHLALPDRTALERLREERLDILLAQTGSAMMEAGVWLRATDGVPFVSVNTIHLPSVYNVVVPEALYNARVQELFLTKIVPWLEHQTVGAYNQGDGLIVLSSGLKRYWEERGVTVPISVIPRAVDPRIFDADVKIDPFAPRAARGSRLLVVCRMTREKGVARLLEIFAQQIAPRHADSTLTLVGDGPDRDTFEELARELGVEQRVFFVGERPLHAIPGYLRHADIFVYTSLSETYGQVVSEAQWCGLPVVALADGMGVSQQIANARTGVLIEPGGDLEVGNQAFGRAVLRLLVCRNERRALGLRAQLDAQARARPERCLTRYYDAFERARAHCAAAKQPKSLQTVQFRSVARWLSLHVAAAGAGLLRPPGSVNRDGCLQPRWDQPSRDSSRRDPVVPLTARKQQERRIEHQP